MANFKKYQHVARFGHGDCQGINEGVCHVFPKIDGTNASVWMDADGVLRCGSRNRELSLERDNQGFCAWAHYGEHNLEAFFAENPTLRLFGEWLVPHTIKAYRDDAWRKFYVFDVIRKFDPDNEGDTVYLHYDEYAPLMEKFGIDYVPCYRVIENGLVSDFEKVAEQNDFLMQPGEIGEGVVVKNYAYKNKFGRHNWAKLVRAEFKEKNYRSMGCPVQKGKGDSIIERVIANTYVTKALVDKERAKIDTEPVQPRLLSTVFHCILTEELADIVKKNKMPTINFQQLRQCVIAKVKEHARDLF